MDFGFKFFHCKAAKILLLMFENVRSITEKLGNERVSNIKIIGIDDVEQSTYSQLVHRKQFSSGLDEEIAKEAKKSR